MRCPKFSIVIPTRDRPDTLRATLQTCLYQDFDDYEIIVSDNASTAATKQVVDELSSSRIVYRRSDRSLCMQDSWNFAYAGASGAWVIFIGDDDALLPFALRQLDDLTARHDVMAVRWRYGIYSWPTISDPAIANYLQLSLLREGTLLPSRATIKDVLYNGAHPDRLPNPYHGAIARSVLEEVRARTGVVFAGFHPDTYASFAVAYMGTRHLFVSIPLTISGFSASSQNIAFSYLRRRHEVATKQRSENADSDLFLDPKVPDLPSLWSVLLDSFLVAKGRLFPGDATQIVDRKVFAERFLRELPIDDLAEWPDAVAEVRRSLSDDPSLLAWFDQLSATVAPSTRRRDPFRPDTLGYGYGFLHLDTTKFGIVDVAGAAKLTAAILACDDVPVALDITEMPDPPSRDSRRKGLRRWLRGAVR